MDWFLRLFDLFLEAARRLAGYLPQSGSDLLGLFGDFMRFAGVFNTWLTETIGVNLQRILGSLGGYVVLALGWFVDLVKGLVERV